MGSKKASRENRKGVTLEFIELRPMTQEEVDSLVQFYFELWRRRYERRLSGRDNTTDLGAKDAANDN